VYLVFLLLVFGFKICSWSLCVVVGVYVFC
jgi:hypothetical protein